MRIQVAATSHIGNKKKSNQDRILVRVGEWQGQDFGIFLVADGMGGLEDGERAADIAVQEADRWWHSDLKMLIDTRQLTERNITSTLRELMLEIHRIIQDESTQRQTTMGTTVSILLIMGGIYYTAHIGDSRIYRIDHQITQLTKDHSWVQNEVDAGRLTPEQAAVHPKRNALLQCAGMPGVPSLDFAKHKITGSLTFLLCSDGFYHYLDSSDVQIQSASTEQGLKTWLYEAQNKVLSQEAHDNLTAIVVGVTSTGNDNRFSLIHKITDYFNNERE